LSDQEFTLLEKTFGRGNVIKEWDIAKDSQDALTRGLQYCPRIDYAIKPLNVTRDVDYNKELIRQAYIQHENIIDEIRSNGLIASPWSTNENPRCFLAIEYENKTSTKHRLGTLINAGALGKVGIIVTLNPKTYRSYYRILEYLKFLQQHRKILQIQNNFIVIEKAEFNRILRAHVANYHI